MRKHDLAFIAKEPANNCPCLQETVKLKQKNSVKIVRQIVQFAQYCLF
jgi:hypothetical protein